MDCQGGGRDHEVMRRTRSGPTRAQRGERGSVLVEFSLVFGLFVLVLYALICFGMILAAKNSITHASAEGARAAIGTLDDPGTPDNEREERAKDKVAESLSWFGSKYQTGDTAADVAVCPHDATKDCITVTITYPYEARPIIPPMPGLGLVTPSSFRSSAVVELS